MAATGASATATGLIARREMVRVSSGGGDKKSTHEEFSTHQASRTLSLATNDAASSTANCDGTKGQKNKENKQQLDKTTAQAHPNTCPRDQLCYVCRRSLAESRHLINVAGHSSKWHPECFKCQICSEPMDKKQSCHVYKDKIVCRNDYVRLQQDNLTKCTRCGWTISASDWVRKAAAHVYHLACFNCDICFRQLNTGEQFAISLQDDGIVHLLCRLHFAINNNQLTEQNQSRTRITPVSANNPPDGQLGDSTLSPLSTYDMQINNNNESRPCNKLSSTKQALTDHVSDEQKSATSSSQRMQYSLGSWTMTANETVKSASVSPSSFAAQPLLHALNLPRSSEHDPMLDSTTSASVTTSDALNEVQHRNMHALASSAISSASSSCTTNAGSGNNLNQSKSKRVRTTFTEDQLTILQSQFQIDSNPDGQDLERIATITGLTKRVTQVWFQNSRARQKKYMIKRKPTSGVTGSGALGCMSLSINNQTSDCSPRTSAILFTQRELDSFQDTRHSANMAPIENDDTQIRQHDLIARTGSWSRMSDSSCDELDIHKSLPSGDACSSSSDGDQLITSNDADDDEHIEIADVEQKEQQRSNGAKHQS